MKKSKTIEENTIGLSLEMKVNIPRKKTIPNPKKKYKSGKQYVITIFSELLLIRIILFDFQKSIFILIWYSLGTKSTSILSLPLR